MTLQSANPPYVLLDDSRSAEKARRSLLFRNPERVVIAKTLADVPGALLQIDAAVAAGFHVAGWVSYECAAAFEPKIANVTNRFSTEPLIWMLVTHSCLEMFGDEVDDWLQDPAARTTGPDLTLNSHGQSFAGYQKNVARIKDYIAAGDIYQANYTFPRSCQANSDIVSLYNALRTEQPVEYGALIQTGDTSVLSLSPELFVRRRGNQIAARPMKGTAARHTNIVEDRAAAISLSADAKSRAENLMIVDLIRNDLSRIAIPGSVSVDDLFTIESYPTLHQMTSGITAECDQSLKPSELLKALFPCGSVTGAPKIRAMEVIAELEQNPRGIYCGAIGHFSPAGAGSEIDWSFNVPIRTLVFDKHGAGRLGIGSGIVHDSAIDDEYAESLLKSGFAERVANNTGFALIETMRLENGDVYLEERHMARLINSACHFDIPINEGDVRSAVEAVCGESAAISSSTDAIYRLRLTVDQQGSVRTSFSSLEKTDDSPLKVGLAKVRLASDDPWLRHKTTNRDLYDRASVAARDLGLADILFLNEKDELVEGAISTLFLEMPDGWATPALSSGALPGVLRTELIDNGPHEILERNVYASDLMSARAIYIGNALRGLREVMVVAEEILF